MRAVLGPGGARRGRALEPGRGAAPRTSARREIPPEKGGVRGAAAQPAGAGRKEGGREGVGLGRASERACVRPSEVCGARAGSPAAAVGRSGCAELSAWPVSGGTGPGAVRGGGVCVPYWGGGWPGNSGPRFSRASAGLRPAANRAPPPVLLPAFGRVPCVHCVGKEAIAGLGETPSVGWFLFLCSEGWFASRLPPSPIDLSQ